MFTLAQVAQHHTTQRLAQLRALLRRDHGARQYRITRDDEVHVYGVMPNTNIVGWRFLGWTDDVAKTYAL